MLPDDQQDGSSRAILHTVAKLHYEGDLSQVEIARRLGLSTATVSRLLRRARQDGIVRIEVRDLASPQDLADQLIKRLGLKRAAVVDMDAAGGPAALSAPLAVFMKDAGLAAGSVVAVGWGRAVREVIAAGLPRLPGVLTVPATGGMQQAAPHFQINEFTRLAAEQMGGTPRFIHAPYLPSPTTHEAFLKDEGTAEVLGLWDRVDVGIVGIGVPHALDASAGRLTVTSDEQALLHAVGDVIRHYYDAGGSLVPWHGENRLIAMSPTQLRAVPLLVGIAISAQKAAAIIGATRAKLVNALVTDVATAQAVLDAEARQDRPASTAARTSE